MKRYIRKVPGGKLVVIKIEITRHMIRKFQLLGDFFLYPEEKIILIENSLINTHQESAPVTLQDIIKNEHITLFGIEVEDIILLISQAFKDTEK